MWHGRHFLCFFYRFQLVGTDAHMMWALQQMVQENMWNSRLCLERQKMHTYCPVRVILHFIISTDFELEQWAAQFDMVALRHLDTWDRVEASRDRNSVLASKNDTCTAGCTAVFTSAPSQCSVWKSHIANIYEIVWVTGGQIRHCFSLTSVSQFHGCLLCK